MSAAHIRSVCGALLLSLSLAAPCAGQARPVWQQSFPGTYGVLVLHNAAARTTVTTRDGAGIDVTAERADGGLLASDAVAVDKSAPGILTLRIAAGQSPTLLEVKVPAHLHVSIQGGSGTVLVQGSLGGLTVETGAGTIVVQLPHSADADISLKTSGEIVTGMTLAPAPAGTNAGMRLGRGGPRVDLRSASGKIFVMPYPAGPAASSHTDRAAVEGPEEPSQQAEPAPPIENAAGNSGRRVRPEAARSAADISVTSQMVLANVRVSAPQGEASGSLTAADFDVLDAGKAQTVAYFAPAQEPLDLILLLDLSGSTKSKFKLIKQAAERFIAALNPSDRVALAGFTSRFLLVSDFTADRRTLLERLKKMKHPEGGTKFYRAMWLSLDLMAKAKGNRKAIVVMTDGVDNVLQGANALASPRVAELLAALSANKRQQVQQKMEEAFSSETDFEALLERISADGVSVYPVYLNTEYEMVVREGRSDSSEYEAAREQLQAIADTCGTPIFKADRIEDLTGAYERVAAELRNLYTIGFYPTDAKEPGAWHELAVNVKREGFAARTRRGYYVD